MTPNEPCAISTAEAYEAFFHAMSEKGVEPIVKTASELFGCPVLFTDENYRLLYQYPQRMIGQDIWDSLYETGTLPLETIWEYQDAFLQQSPTTYEPFYADWGLAREFPRIFGEVYTKKKQILGHIAIFMMGRPLLETDLEVTSIFIDALRMKMTHSEASPISNANYLMDLINDKATPQRKLLAERILLDRIKGAYYIMVTPTDGSAANRSFAATLCSHLNRRYTNSASVLYKEHLVTLIGHMSGNEHDDRNQACFQAITSEILQTYASLGISSIFTDLQVTAAYFQQALLTRALVSQGILFFSDAAPLIIMKPSLSFAPLAVLIHPVLQAIQEHDREKGTEYYATLRSYSLHFHKMDETASDLKIHRNTLLYRLNRICEFFSLPLEDNATAIYLLNSFQLLEADSERG